MIAESILPNFAHYSENKTYTVGDITMDVTNVYHEEDSYMVSNLLYTKDGKTEEHSYKHYVFTLVSKNLSLSQIWQDIKESIQLPLDENQKHL